MKRLSVDFSKTNSFPQIFLDYIEGKESLKPFYKYPIDIASFKKVIEDKSKEQIDRKILVEVLKEQNLKLQTSNLKLSENVDSLLSDKTFTVTTGHQSCIFTGPLYSVYKILTTIRLAQELKKNYDEYNFVPVFWMVTEDHDFEEINYINIYGKKLKWVPSEEQQSVAGKIESGKLNCEGLNPLIDELKGMLGESENANYLINLFRSAYSENHTLAEATRIIINELFGKYGLVILDAGDRRLKNLFKDVMKEELLQSSSHKYVNETIAQLSAQYKPQVNPREINLFYLDNGLRSRIVKTENGFAVVDSNKKFTEAEIITEMEQHPENFSPNVVLRPLYEEKILPDLAYIGGPGEISYWLEYRKMFEHFNINYPMLVARNCAMWLDEASSAKMNKLSIRSEDFFLETESLVKVFIENNFDHSYSLEEESKQLEKVFNSLVEKVNAVDVTLKASVEAEKQKQLNALKHIEDKVVRAQKKKNETAIGQVRKIKEKLFPEGVLQERYDNFILYYVKHGTSYFDLLLENFDALPDKFLVLEEGVG